jgi:hypothetical protein
MIIWYILPRVPFDVPWERGWGKWKFSGVLLSALEFKRFKGKKKCNS